MTENEAIKEIETSLELAEMCTPNREREKEIKAYKMAIQALEKVQAFEAIGTIEEFKALKEKEERFDRNIKMFNEIGLEIRNKAIDEFFEELQKYEDDDMWLRLKMSSIYEIAEQMKAGEIDG